MIEFLRRRRRQEVATNSWRRMSEEDIMRGWQRRERCREDMVWNVGVN